MYVSTSPASGSVARTVPRTSGPAVFPASANACSVTANTGASFASVSRTVTDASASRPSGSVTVTVNSQTPGPVSESSPPPT